MQRSVLSLGWLVVADAVPPLTQLFDRGDVYAPVMKEIFEGRHVFKKKASVLSDGVTAEWSGLELTVVGNLLNRLLLCVFDRDRGCPNSFHQTRLY